MRLGVVALAAGAKRYDACPCPFSEMVYSPGDADTRSIANATAVVDPWR
jgi:hypothetical protein